MIVWSLVCVGIGVAIGWFLGVRLCSKRRWCPIHMSEALHAWHKQIEAERKYRAQGPVLDATPDEHCWNAPQQGQEDTITIPTPGRKTP